MVIKKKKKKKERKEKKLIEQEQERQEPLSVIQNNMKKFVERVSAYVDFT